MSTKLGEAFIEIITKDSTDAGYEAARLKANSFVHDLTTGIAQGIGQFAARTIGSLISGAVDEIGKAVEASSNLTETINKVGIAFGESSKDIIAWSQNSDTALGQSQRQALDAASSFALLFKNVGLGVQPTADMSKSLVQLATDLSSVYNIPIDQTLDKLQSGLTGQIRPLRELNIFISDTAVQQKALQLGLADTTDSLSEQDKVLARYALILQQGKIAQGDFAKTSGELANAEKILAAQEEDALTRIGDVIKPVKLAFVRGLSDLLTTVAPYGEGVMNAFAGGLARGIVSITPVLLQMRQVFVNLLEAHSPPKLLPELTEWGKKALASYMQGWSDPDTSALKTLGGAIEGILRSASGAGQIKETNLVARVFGSQKALVEAINEWRASGTITADTLSNIVRQARPAGEAVSGLVTTYFNLQDATKKVNDAQDDLNATTRRYSDALDPLNKQLDAIDAAQQTIRDNQRLEALGKELLDPTVGADQKQLDRLEIQRIELTRQKTAIEGERDTAVGAAQAKIDAAKKEQDAQQAKLDQAQAILDGQAKTNDLIAEEINLRKRLADEAKAAQDKIAAADKQRAAELERIHQAQLNFNLASTDTAGQLALEEAELAKATVGSADYYDILTRIVELKRQLKKEQDAAGANDAGALAGIIPDAGTLTKTGQGISDLSTALDALFKGLAGKSEPVAISPFWANVEQTIKDIGQASKDALPEIQALFDVFTGKSDQPLPTADPFKDSFWLAHFVPAINGTINALDLIRKGKWSELWASFSKSAFDVFQNSEDEGRDPKDASIIVWIYDRLIPAIQLLATGDWKDAVGLLLDPLALIVKDAYTDGYELIGSWWQGVQDWFSKNGALLNQWFDEQLHKYIPDSMFPVLPSAPNPNKQPHNPDGSPVSPQSFPGSGIPGIAPMAMQLAPSSVTNGPTSADTYYIEQHISTNGDFGGARSGAESGIREALINRRLKA